MCKPNQLTTFKRIIAFILIFGQLLTSCKHPKPATNPGKDPDLEKKLAYTKAALLRPKSTTKRPEKEKATRKHVKGNSSSHQQQMQYERKEGASIGQDFFERSKEALREGEEKLDELHRDQARRRQVEQEQLEQSHRAWQEKLARKQEQRLQEEKERAAREEAEQKEEAIRRQRGETWLQEGAENLRKEKEEREQVRQEAEDKAYEEQQKEKEREQQTLENLHSLAKERLEEKARQEKEERLRLEQERQAKEARKAAKEEARWNKWDEAEKRAQEESRRQQEEFRDKIHNEIEKNERKRELECKQMEEAMEKASQAMAQLAELEILKPKPVELDSSPTLVVPFLERTCLSLKLEDLKKDEDEDEKYIADLKRRLEKKASSLPETATSKPTVVPPPDLSEYGLDLDSDWDWDKHHKEMFKELDEYRTKNNWASPPPQEMKQSEKWFACQDQRGIPTPEEKEAKKKQLITASTTTSEQENPTTSTENKTSETEKKLGLADQKLPQEKTKPTTQATKKKVEKEKELSSGEESDSYEDTSEEEDAVELTLENATSQIEAYLQAVEAGILSPEEQKAGCQALLTEVEVLKKREKRLYRLCNESMIINSDFDSEAIKICKKEAQQHKEQLDSLRTLRSQLQRSCELTTEELAACNIKVKNSTEESEDGYEVDSSDEDIAYLYSRGDLALREGAANGVVKALKKAPERVGKDLESLLTNPLTTVEGLTTCLKQIPGLFAALPAYIDSFEGHEKERGEEIGEFVTEQVINMLLITLVKLPVGLRRIGKLGKAVQKLVEEAKQLEKLGKAVTGIKKGNKLERQAQKKIRQAAKLQRRAKRKADKAAKKNQQQTSEGTKEQPEVQKESKKETKEWNGKYKKKKPGVSGKEGAKGAPSWAKEFRPREGESGKEFAKRIMDEKYGPGDYKEGTGTQFNQIKKWADRSFE